MYFITTVVIVYEKKEIGSIAFIPTYIPKVWNDKRDVTRTNE